MTDRTYPGLPQSLGLSLEAIRQQMDFDPGYLTDPECPYDDRLRVALRRLIGPLQTGRGDLADAVFVEGQNDSEQADSLIEEVKRAINSMRRLQSEIEASDDVTDRLNFLKNSGSLFDRFLSIKEKATGLKQMYDFQRIVIQVMEQLLDKDQRLDFKEKLKAANISMS